MSIDANSNQLYVISVIPTENIWFLKVASHMKHDHEHSIIDSHHFRIFGSTSGNYTHTCQPFRVNKECLSEVNKLRMLDLSRKCYICQNFVLMSWIKHLVCVYIELSDVQEILKFHNFLLLRLCENVSFFFLSVICSHFTLRKLWNFSISLEYVWFNIYKVLPHDSCIS